PLLVGFQARGMQLLESSPELQIAATRSVKRHLSRPVLSLPPPGLPPVGLAEVLTRRRSRVALGGGAVPMNQLSTVLDAAYGVTAAAPLAVGEATQAVRTAPSAGALYPLELYLLVLRGGDPAPGLYHYDPLRHALEQLGDDPRAGELRAALVAPELVDG